MQANVLFSVQDCMLYVITPAWFLHYFLSSLFFGCSCIWLHTLSRCSCCFVHSTVCSMHLRVPACQFHGTNDTKDTIYSDHVMFTSCWFILIVNLLCKKNCWSTSDPLPLLLSALMCVSECCFFFFRWRRGRLWDRTAFGRKLSMNEQWHPWRFLLISSHILPAAKIPAAVVCFFLPCRLTINLRCSCNV